MVKHVIDCDANSFLPHEKNDDYAYYIKKFIKNDKFVWNPNLIKLIPISEILDRFSNSSGKIDGWAMFDYFNDAFKPCNGTIAAYLLKFRHLIPESWKNNPILFLNTVYGKKYGGKKNEDAYVRFLGCEYSGLWNWEIEYFRIMDPSHTIYFFDRSCKIKETMVPCFV